MFDNVPINLYEALLVLSFLNGLVLLVGNAASEAERTERESVPRNGRMRRIPTPQFLLACVLVGVPFLALGGLAAAVGGSFLVQRGWIYHSSGTTTWMLVVGLSTGILTLVFAISHSITDAYRKRNHAQYLTNFYQMVDRVTVSVGYGSGGITLIVVGLSAAFGNGTLVG